MTQNIILGITGGIAAYKVAELASKLSKLDFNVLPVMTSSAQKFIGSETFRSLTGNDVTTKLFAEKSKIPHISLLENQPAAIVIAPASANIIGKIANGLADDILTTTIMAAPKIPKIIVPSMNTEMWENPILQQNIEKLRSLGSYYFIEPDYGDLACGTIGKGRYPDNQLIINSVLSISNLKSGSLKGKKILIVSGGTREPIDDVRVITNLSSGKMGQALKQEAYKQAAEVTFIDASSYNVDQLETIIQEKVPDNDIIVMVAAISDYRVAPIAGKISSDHLTLKLTKTQDILENIKGTFKVGFALEETKNLTANAHKKLISKDLNIIVANSIETLESDEATVSIITKDNKELSATGNKNIVASKIIKVIADEFESYIYANAVCS